jgi:hypothetical protein
MTPVYQPKRSKLCGHACVAMVAGVSLAEAVLAIGHRRATKTSDLIPTLRKLGVRCGDQLRIAPPDNTYTGTCIVQLRWPRRRNWHWVVIHDGALYDPSPNPRGGGRLGAYLEIFR